MRRSLAVLVVGVGRGTRKRGFSSAQPVGQAKGSPTTLVAVVDVDSAASEGGHAQRAYRK